MRFLTDTDTSMWEECILPLDSKRMEGAGVDLTIGGVGTNLTSGEEVSFEDGEVMEIRPGDFVNVQTAETVTLTCNQFGLIFAKVSLTRRGFTAFGSKIDPGFNGRLMLSFMHNGHSIQKLREGSVICMVSIVEMGKDVGKPYSPSPIIAPTYRPVVSLSLEASDNERGSYNNSFSRAQLQIFDSLRKLHPKFLDLQESMNVSRRQVFIGFLTTTLPTVVLGLIVASIALIALLGASESFVTRVQKGGPLFPIILSCFSVAIASVALYFSWRRKQ